MDGAALIVIGVALLAISWMCWSGRWRAWSKIAMLPALPIAIGPFLGACLLLCGIGTLTGVGRCTRPRCCSAPSASSSASGAPAGTARRWFRERDTTYDLSVPLNAAIASSVRTTPARSSDAVARSQGWPRAGRALACPSGQRRARPAERDAAEGVVRGHLLLYDDALVFAADVREDRMRGARSRGRARPSRSWPCDASPPAAGPTARVAARTCRRG